MSCDLCEGTGKLRAKTKEVTCPQCKGTGEKFDQDDFSSKMNKKVAPTTEKLPHLLLKALAGTGKTFTLIVGVAWAFGSKLWPQIQRTIGERINERSRLAWQKDTSPNRPRTWVPKITDLDNFRITPSPEQQLVWDQFALSAKDGAKSITYSAFNKSIVIEFNEEWGWMVKLLNTLGINLQFATVNALGNRTITNAFGKVNCVTHHTNNIIAKYFDTDTRLMKQELGGASLISSVAELVGLCKLTMAGWNGTKLVGPTEKELDNLCAHYEILIEGPRYKTYPGATLEEQVYDLVPRILQSSLNVEESREIDFNDQNWLPVVLGLGVSKVDLLLIDEGQDLPRAKQEYAVRVGRRIVVVGDSHQCQPAGTMITHSEQGNRWYVGRSTTVPIENIGVGDYVTSWDRSSSSLVARSRVTKVANMDYDGYIYTVEAGDKSTKCTPNHKWVTRWVTNNTDLWCVYIMRRTRETSYGPVDDYRIGWCQLFTKVGDLHLAQRARLEEADAAWILTLHNEKSEASIQEAFLANMYQIPLLPFTGSNGTGHYTNEWLNRFWNRIQSCVSIEDNAYRLFNEFGLLFEHPLYNKARQQKQGRKSPFETVCCNLIPKLMAIPLAPEVINSENPAVWSTITSCEKESFTGKVYSLEVEPHHKYIADGLITCNSCYGFAGADVESMPRMQGMLKVDNPLYLTQTRRCGKAIVAEALEHVPTFSAHPSNGDGLVRYALYSNVNKEGEVIKDDSGTPVFTYHDEVEDRDMVLCRLNAPLVAQALRFLSMGRKANLRGRDFGKQLVEFIKKLRPISIIDLHEKVYDWVAREEAKERKREHPNEVKIQGFLDRATCIDIFSEGCKDVDEVGARIYLVFSGKQCPRCKQHFPEEMDTCPEKGCLIEKNDQGWPVGPKLTKPEGIMLSSIHKAKGLEARRVFFLMPEGAECPLPYAKLPWQVTQEKNLRYIGQTRAIEELVYVL